MQRFLISDMFIPLLYCRCMASPEFSEVRLGVFYIARVSSDGSLAMQIGRCRKRRSYSISRLVE